MLPHFDNIGINDKENTPRRNVTQKSSITNVSPETTINPFRTPFHNVTNQVFRPINPQPSEPKPGLTQQARKARKEILNNKRTIGLTTTNRGYSLLDLILRTLIFVNLPKNKTFLTMIYV